VPYQYLIYLITIDASSRYLRQFLGGGFKKYFDEMSLAQLFLLKISLICFLHSLNKFDFIKYLKYALIDHKQLSLPGIGTFKLIRTPAQINQGTLNIDPPSYGISYDYDASEDQVKSTFDTVKTYYPSLDRQDLMMLSSIFGKAKETKKKFALDGIGSFSFENNKPHFEADQQINNALTGGLGVVKQKYISQRSKISDWASSPKADIPNEKWFRWLPVAALLLGCIALLPFFKNRLQYKNSDIVTKDSVVQNDIISSDTLVYDQDTNEIKSMVDTLNEVLGSNTAVNIEDIKNEQGTNLKKCVIITGAYTSEKYKQIMIDKILSNGYELYTDKARNMTRVGLQFECEGKDLLDMLRKIRSMFVSDAWYLDPLSVKQG
jgi:hypothetical protein